MYIGSDVHKKNSNYTMIDGQGREVEKGRFPTTAKVWTSLRAGCLKMQK